MKKLTSLLLAAGNVFEHCPVDAVAPTTFKQLNQKQNNQRKKKRQKM